MASHQAQKGKLNHHQATAGGEQTRKQNSLIYLKTAKDQERGIIYMKAGSNVSNLISFHFQSALKINVVDAFELLLILA